MKQLFTKTFYSPQQHIVLLKNRGLLIADEEKAARYIYNIGYFRLSAYFYPLLKFPKEQHLYKPGATFVQALNMYRFDRKLRLLLFNEIEKIEVAIRSCITNAVSEYFNDLFWITNPAYFFNMQSFRYTQDTIDAELKKSKEDFILHFRSAYTDDYPPAWMIAEILPLGLLCRIYTNLKDNVLKSATKLFSVLLASKRPLITELADKLRLKYPLLPTISPCPTMRLEAIRSIIPISCRRYPKSV